MVALQRTDIQEQYEELPIDQVLHGDCLEEMRKLPSNSIHAIVTDPPYGLGEVKDIAALLLAWCRGEDGKEYANTQGFMSKSWDVVPSPNVWKEAYRVLRPGGYLLAFAGTRTWDLMSMSIRLAGFEDRDTINHAFSQHLAWFYGSGFPKSTAIDKAIDKHLGKDKEREVVGKGINYDAKVKHGGTWTGGVYAQDKYTGSNGPVITAPATPESAKWVGWGNNLKPAWEPILVFRKPLDGTLAQNVLTWGCGGINIDATRVNGHSYTQEQWTKKEQARTTGNTYGEHKASDTPVPSKRFPSNLLLSHDPRCIARGTKRVRANRIGAPNQHERTDHPTYGKYEYTGGSTSYNDEHGQEEVQAFECVDGCPVRVLGEQSGERKSGASHYDEGFRHEGLRGNQSARITSYHKESDTGTAARYFQQFHDPLETLDAPFYYFSKASKRDRSSNGAVQNTHPTTKNTELMRWLVRLVGVPGGVILDPFAGSGSTLVACIRENMSFIGIEQDASYVEICNKRIAAEPVPLWHAKEVTE